jgi:hypothetical protein
MRLIRRESAEFRRTERHAIDPVIERVNSLAALNIDHTAQERMVHATLR